MTANQASATSLDQSFHGIRSRLLDIAADLDRAQRSGVPQDDTRLAKIRQSLGILAGAHLDRATQIQMLFSLPYEPDWRSGMS